MGAGCLVSSGCVSGSFVVSLVFFFSGEGNLWTILHVCGDESVSGGVTFTLGLSCVGTERGRLGESTLTGSSSMNFEIGGGPSSGDSAESVASASDRRARICSGL